MTQPFILAFAADAQGCGYHRIMIPGDSIARAGLARVQAEMRMWMPQMLQLARPDTIVWQRQIEQQQLAQMREYRAMLPDAFFVYEVDDLLNNLPSSNFHLPFMPPADQIEGRVRTALNFCDAATTTTEYLAEWLFRLGANDVRVVPNMMRREDFENCRAIRKEFAARKDDRLRIGWGGGISHAGDLRLIEPAMRSLGDAVQWVFLGMKPTGDLDGLDIEFHEGTSSGDYLKALCKLDLDLILAPLEDHPFNHAKSNLRLLEAGACYVPVLASRVTPYCTPAASWGVKKAPPVFGLCDNHDWESGIRAFMTATKAQRESSTRELHEWVKQHYTMESNIGRRAAAWNAPSTRATLPVKPPKGAPTLIVSCAEQAPQALPDNVVQAPTLAAAADLSIKTGADVIMLRPSTLLPTEAFARLIKASREAGPEVASVSILSNDGIHGGSFPRKDGFSMLTPDNIEALNKLAGDELQGEFAEVPWPGGPVVLLRAQAFAKAGIPDTRGYQREENALIEWGCYATAGQMHHIVLLDTYCGTVQQPQIPQQMSEMDSMRAKVRLGTAMETALKSDWVKAYDQKFAQARERLERAFLGKRHMIPGTVPPVQYQAWRDLFTIQQPNEVDLLNADDGVLAANKFGVVLLDGAEACDSQGGFGEGWPTTYNTVGDAAAAGCSWVMFKQPGITLLPGAAATLLTELREIYRGHKDGDILPAVIYADHEMEGPEGRENETRPAFKPGFDFEMAVSRNYFTQAMAMRIAGTPDVHAEFARPTDGMDLYHQCLQLADQLLVHGVNALDLQKHFRHSHHILARTSRHALFDADAHREWLRNYFSGRIKAVGKHAHPELADAACVRWRAAPPAAASEDYPLVSIVIPTKGDVWMLRPCLQTILARTKYPNFEIIVVDNGAGTAVQTQGTEDARVRVVRWAKDFNWSELNNWAIQKHARGEYIMLLNDDTRIVTENWLHDMVGMARQPFVGAVGARLLYPAGLLQHAGVICHKGTNAHLHKGMHGGMGGYLGVAMLNHENVAQTGAALLFSRKIYDEIGGLDERYRHNFNDVVFCLMARRKGYRNPCVCTIDIQHMEGVTRTPVNSPEGMKTQQAEYAMLMKEFPEADPYWNINLGIISHNGGMFVSGLNYELMLWPPEHRFPWRDHTKERVGTLVIDSIEQCGHLARAGCRVFMAEMKDFYLVFTNPGLENSREFNDIRKAEKIIGALMGLGIKHVYFGKPPAEGTEAVFQTFMTKLWQVDIFVVPPAGFTIPGLMAEIGNETAEAA